jgi:DEAD/DEAH box helicase domain-containing protein
MINEVIFDVETKKFFDDIEGDDPGLLGVSIVSLYARELDDDLKEISGKMQSFWEAGFSDMWPIFAKANRIIGFNSLKFDVPALKPYAPPDFSKLSHFDIMDQVKRITGHRVSLDAIAKETLKRYKIDSGANAIKYWHKGDPKSLALLKKYCEEDVAITKDIYDFVVANEYLMFKDHWNTARKVGLDFSYPVATGQASLF